MISIRKCNEILGTHGIDLSEKEIKEIRGILYAVAQLQIDMRKESDNAKGNIIHPGFN